MTLILFIYIIGCIAAFIAFFRIQKYAVVKWTLKDAIILSFVTIFSWFSLFGLLVSVIILYAESMDDDL